MSEKWSWFDRSFDFAFPASKMPDILERLRGTPFRIDALLQEVDPAIRQRRAGETWSIQENLGHLGDLEPLWIGRVEDMMAGQEIMREADLTNRATHEANHHDDGIDITVTRFRDLRSELVSMLVHLEPDDWSLASLHPRLKTPMRIVDLALFVADHDDYHMARCRHLMGDE